MSNEKKAFSLEVIEKVAVVTIDVPGETMNTLKGPFADEIREVLQQIEAEPQVKGVVFTSGKPDSFIAGADISMLAACKTTDEAEGLAKSCHAIFAELEQLDLPVVAAIHGVCLGGGLEFAMACHARVCSADDKTRLGLPEVQLGLLPGGGGTQRLPRLVGVAKALDMMLTGKQLRAKQALKMGLVNEVVPKQRLLETAIRLAKQGKPAKKAPPRDMMGKVLETNSLGRKVMFDQARKQLQAKTKGNYPAPERIIDVVETGQSKGFEAGLAKEAECFGQLVLSAESEQLRNLFFVTTAMKKEVSFDGAKPVKVKKAVVLGGGLMGGGIANVSAMQAKVPVRIKDISQEGIRHALKYSYDKLSKQVARGRLTEVQAKKKMSQLSGTVTYSGVKDADIVIEAVFEDLKLKHQMVKDVEANFAESTVFASNTSSLPIGQIAEAASRPENVIGLHYFSPVDKMPLVEVIAHEKTSAQTIATTVAFARKQGKTPIVVKDGAGFYVNRILALYMNEAAQLVLSGAPVEMLDKAVVQFGFPVGPVTLMDEVGIDVSAKIAPILTQELGERFASPKAFDDLIADGRKGKKNSKGFYDYQPKKKGIKGIKGKKGKQVDESVYRVLGVSPKPEADHGDLAERCVIQMLNEAARCLEEGIIASARDGDIGAIFGIGFPPFLGGPFHYMDKLGAGFVVDRLDSYRSQYGERFAPCDLLRKMAEEGSTFY